MTTDTTARRATGATDEQIEAASHRMIAPNVVSMRAIMAGPWCIDNSACP